VTQIVAAGNWNYAFVLADRRFTVHGELVDQSQDEQNKLILLATPTARLAVAFCGLASLDGFRTESWLAGLLVDAQRRGGGTPDLDWMCERATADFGRLPNLERRPQDAIDPKCIWIVLAGFVSERDSVLPTYVQFSNAAAVGARYEAREFHVEVYGPTTPSERDLARAYAMSFGAVLMDRAYVDELKRIVSGDGSPPQAIGAALRTIHHARENANGRRLIGQRCGAVIVWSERDRQPEGWYYGKRGAATHFMPTLVTRHGITANVAVDRRTTRVARNAPCTCGSGRTFGRCHGAPSSGVRGAHPK
jgi:hypothetical protein